MNTSVSESEIDILDALVTEADFETARELITDFKLRDPFETPLLDEYIAYMNGIDKILDEEDYQ